VQKKKQSLRQDDPDIQDDPDTGALDLKVEKLVYGGDGLARGPAGTLGAGKAIFLPFVLAGERVEARMVEEKPGFARALADNILEPSPERIPPECTYYGQCGGCHYQHTAYQHQLRLKAAILGESLRRIAGVEIPSVTTHPSQPWHYRNRTRLKVQGSGGFALVYFQAGSQELLPVEQCPISSPLINRAITAAWQVGRAQRTGSVIRELEFFANAADDQLLVELALSEEARPFAPARRIGSSGSALLEFAGELRRALPEIAGIAVFRTAGKNLVREQTPDGLKAAFGSDNLVYHAGGWQYQVSAGSFFQTNRYLTETLIQLVAADQKGETALDLYAGAGTFSLPLAPGFRHVTAVESSPFSHSDLKRNAPPTVRARRQRVEDFLQHLPPATAFDLVVVDPPRCGLGETVTSRLSRLPTARLTYVSCDPATLARDLKTLLAAGFHIQQMHLVDLFPQTFHIESVTRLAR
jgi:23S rRNA (uracil1939-C5)-methyltransferase